MQNRKREHTGENGEERATQCPTTGQESCSLVSGWWWADHSNTSWMMNFGRHLTRGEGGKLGSFVVRSALREGRKSDRYQLLQQASRLTPWLPHRRRLHVSDCHHTRDRCCKLLCRVVGRCPITPSPPSNNVMSLVCWECSTDYLHAESDLRKRA